MKKSKKKETQSQRNQKIKDAIIEIEGQKALRYNNGKLKWSLVHFKSLEPMVRVLEFGAKKYSPDNWKKGLDRKEILESSMRHLTAMLDGEIYDKESGLPHIGHFLCNGMFLSYYQTKDLNWDNDFRKDVKNLFKNKKR